jgi:hypothetical protein
VNGGLQKLVLNYRRLARALCADIFRTEPDEPSTRASSYPPIL